MRKYKNHLMLLVKILFLTLVYGFLLIKLNHKFTNISSLTMPDSWLFILFLAVMAGLWIGNLSLEALKWKALLRGHREISFKESMRNVLQGMAFGIFTPYRIGEWFGRVLVFERKRKTGIIMGMIGSIMQMLVIGLIGGLFLIPKLFHAIEAGSADLKSVLLLIALLIMGVFALSGQIKNRRSSRLKQFQRIVAGQPIKWYVETFCLTWLRYMVFSVQLALLLVLLTGISFYDIVITVPVYFFVISFLPSFPIADLGVRISSGLVLFSNHQAYVLEISTAVAVLWLLNVCIPVLLGSLLAINRPAWWFTEIRMPALRKHQINFSFDRFYKPMK